MDILSNIKPQSSGGKATAIVLRKKALERYYSNPNKCLFCNKVLEIPDGAKVSTIRRNKFCNQSCGAKYNNQNRKRKAPYVKKDCEKICLSCNTKFLTKNRIKKYCKECQPIVSIADKTKGDFFKYRKNWQSARSSIRRHAGRIYNNSGQPKKCFKCGYDTYYEICHKKPVSSFPPDATVKEINDISNLIILCPNHHWEFDHGILKID